MTNSPAPETLSGKRVLLGLWYGITLLGCLCAAIALR